MPSLREKRQRMGMRPTRFTPEQIQRRILAVMANEGARVLDEGISLRPSDIDLVFVNGYGFPRLKGGPMFAADQRGLATVLVDVEEAARAGGAGSEPAPLLVQLARDGSSFAAWQAGQSKRDQARYVAEGAHPNAAERNGRYDPGWAMPSQPSPRPFRLAPDQGAVLRERRDRGDHGGGPRHQTAPMKKVA